MFSQFVNAISNANTRETYARGLGYFEDWASDAGIDVQSLRVKDILSFRTHLSSKLSSSSANTYLSSLRSFLKWAARMELVEPAVYQAAAVVENVAIQDRLPAVLNLEEVSDLLCLPDTNTLAGARDLAFIALLVSSGVRVSEAAGIDFETLDLRNRSARVFGKGSKERKVFFNGKAAAALEHYFALRSGGESGPVFVNRWGRRISVRYMQERVAAYGLSLESGERLHPHTLRHTFATMYLDRTGDLDAVRRQLGHSRAETTQVYTRTATSRLEKQYREVMEEPELVLSLPVRSVERPVAVERSL